MEWYYSKDGRQEGPVTLDELRGMLAGGGLRRDRTLVWREGMSEWTGADKVGELAPAGPVVPAAVGGAAQPPPGMVAGAPPQMNGLALASLILGIVSFVMGTMAVTGIPAVICGHLARRQIRANPATQSGDGMAVGGLVTGYLSILLTVVIAVVVVVVLVVAVREVSTMSPPAPVAPGGP